MCQAKNFIILSIQRSGSELLTTLLDSHPDIHCESEALHHGMGKAWLKYYYGQSMGLKAYGFKVMTNQLGGGLLDMLLGKFNCSVIYLYRNAIHRTISDYINRRKELTGRGAHSVKSEPVVSFTVDLKDFAGMYRWDQLQRDALDEVLSRVPDPRKLKIDYSDLAAALDPSGVLSDVQSKRLVEFLGVGNHDVTIGARMNSYLVKQNPEDPASYIENYEDVLKVAKPDKLL